jgi:hypothetical protein
VGPTQGLTEWVPGTFLEDKVPWGVRLITDFDRSAEVKNALSYTCTS